MQPKLYRIFLAGFLGLFGYGMAENRDCDGYAVADSAIIDSTLQSKLSKVQDTAFLDFSVGFRWPGFTSPPDSCSKVNVLCESPSDTISRKYWGKWSRDLFGKYEIYLIDFPDHRVTADKEFSISDHYSFVRATKATIVSIGHECYTWELDAATKSIPASIDRAPKENASRNSLMPGFDARGKKLKSRIASKAGVVYSPKFRP